LIEFKLNDPDLFIEANLSCPDSARLTILLPPSGGMVLQLLRGTPVVAEKHSQRNMTCAILVYKQISAHTYASSTAILSRT
jgi:hypothetical protein